MPAAEPCRLYLITPATIEPAGFAASLDSVLDAGDIACLRLECDGDDDTIKRTADALVPVCRAHDVALLLTDRPHLVAPTGADGVHMTQALDGVRDELPADTILGAGCGLSRHDALVAGDLESDYVSFGPAGSDARDIIRWWNQMVVLPSVAEGVATLQDAAAMAEAGADFLALSEAVWDHPDGPAAAVTAFDTAIAKYRDH
ncbi:MAG: thiamine phosphate synthase [Pseudomonadota bacterium]